MGAENEDLQRLFVAFTAEKGHCLLITVVVQIHHLNGLDVTPAGGGRVFVAVGQQVVDLPGQIAVLDGQLGQGKQTLRVGRR